MLLIKQAQVLQVLDRQDPKTLSNWYSIQDWFPAPALQGRPPRWDQGSIQEWIDDWIPRLYEAGVTIPELRDYQSAQAYAKACRDRLAVVIEGIKAEDRRKAEARDRIRSIVRVYRTIPRTA